jgi:hypothetical protein
MGPGMASYGGHWHPSWLLCITNELFFHSTFSKEVGTISEPILTRLIPGMGAKMKGHRRSRQSRETGDRRPLAGGKQIELAGVQVDVRYPSFFLFLSRMRE